MAATRGGESMDLWLERSVHDSSNALTADDLEQLRTVFGDASTEQIEKALATTHSTDFETASDEQIIEVVRKLVTSGAPRSASAEPVDDARDFTPPSDEDLVAAVVTGILDDFEFQAALNAQWQQGVAIPSEAAAGVVDEIVELIKAGVWQGLEEAIKEFGDDVPNEAQFTAAAAELGLA